MIFFLARQNMLISLYYLPFPLKQGNFFAPVDAEHNFIQFGFRSDNKTINGCRHSGICGIAAISFNAHFCQERLFRQIAIVINVPVLILIVFPFLLTAELRKCFLLLDDNPIQYQSVEGVLLHQ